MSRGPGRWQRAILDELQRRERFFVRELLGYTYTRSDRLAVARAAHRLAAQGKLTLETHRYGWACRSWQMGVAVGRPGVDLSWWAFRYPETTKILRERAAAPAATADPVESRPPPSKLSDIPAGISLKPYQLGSVASLLKLLLREGSYSETALIERLGQIHGRVFTPELVRAAIDHLKASGHYQRLLTEAQA